MTIGTSSGFRVSPLLVAFEIAASMVSARPGVDIPMEGLREEERDQQARYDAAVKSDAMLRQTVEQIESVAGDIDEERLPSGDDLAREIERFLRGQTEPGEADG